jgi:hemoglobin
MEQDRTSLYEVMGKETGIRKLVDYFYDAMSANPEAKEILVMHPKDLSSSRDKLYYFLVGWTGGPQLFVERFGHPRLRMRHFPFKIGIKERDQWLMCFDAAVNQMDYSEEIKSVLMPAINNLANHMRNQNE